MVIISSLFLWTTLNLFATLLPGMRPQSPGNFLEKSEAGKELLKYYKGREANPYAQAFTGALNRWDAFAEQHDFPYSLAYGSLMGYMRHPSLCFIPYDHDTDIFVDAKGINVMLTLAKKPDSGVQFVNVLGHKATGLVVVHPFVDELPGPEGSRRNGRWDCDGVAVDSQMDPCSFNGPIARILIEGGVWTDIYMYSMHDKTTHEEFLRKQGANASAVLKELECYSVGEKEHCVYPSSGMASPLPELSKASCGGMKTYVFKEKPFAEAFLKAVYSESYMIPNK